MGVGLPPLDFTECLSDSPFFRENLHKHEKELENTNQQIKRLIKEVKDLLGAAKTLSNAQRSFAKELQSFTFECIGESQTDDEITISGSLKEFGKLINLMEDERDRMLKTAHERVTVPLEKFRKKNIADVKNGKKRFDKQTSKFFQTQERHLNLTTKKQNSLSLQEADASVDMAERHFYNASMDYVYLIQEVHERKKFEFVESLLSFMFGWVTFYHQGYETAKDFSPYMNDLQFKIQKTRDNFEDYRLKLTKRMAEIQKQSLEEPVRGTKGEKSGYLFLLEKKAFGATWTKHYCTYNKETKQFSMVPYNQLTTKSLIEPEIMVLASCIRRMSDSIDKRFCFDLQTDAKPGSVLTFQALSESDRKTWMDIMDGKEPTYTIPVKLQNSEERILDEVGIQFVKRCIEVLETRGLEEQGMYRVVGVMSKVTKLLNMGLDRRKAEKLAGLDDPQEWETKTITSALKCYLRNLPEPIMTYRYHNGFIAAVKNETRQTRINDVHTLVYRLPKLNIEVLKILIKHLSNVAAKSDKNLMTVSNLSVCFGPTLLRPEEETVASIVDLKFYNVVVEILIDNYERIFTTEPPPGGMLGSSVSAALGLQAQISPNADAEMSPFKMTMRELGQQPVKTIRNYTSNNAQSIQYKIQAFYDPTSANVQPPPMTNALSTSLYNVHHDSSNASPLHSANTNGAAYINTANLQHASTNNKISDYGVISQQSNAIMSKSTDYGTTGSHSNGSSMSASALGAVLPPLHNRIKQYMNSAGTQSETNIAKLGCYGGMRGDGIGTGGVGSSLAYTHLEPNSTSSSNESVSSNSRDGGSGGPPPGAYLLNNHMSPEKPHSNRSNSIGMPYPQHYRPVGAVRVRTLYACVGENDGELSFEPNQIITNVKSSQEPGWLEGTLNGRTGLIPENYVEILP